VSPERRHLRLSPRYDRITLHHAGNGMVCAAARSQIARDLQGVLTAHLARGYGDIGYHFVVDYNGRVWEGRSLAYEGAHVLCENERNIGIMLLGNFEKQKPSPAQVRTIAELVPLLRRRWRIRRHRIYGHCDLGQSICPGRNLYSHVARMRA
jgi:N-acetyl-anhydromuramyl-L-alanine amidase AmpD